MEKACGPWQGPEKPLFKIEGGAPEGLGGPASYLGLGIPRTSAQEGECQGRIRAILWRTGSGCAEAVQVCRPAPSMRGASVPPTIVFGGFGGLEFKVRFESLGLGFEVWV